MRLKDANLDQEVALLTCHHMISFPIQIVSVDTAAPDQTMGNESDGAKRHTQKEDGSRREVHAGQIKREEAEKNKGRFR
jgi:hypothetical protein